MARLPADRRRSQLLDVALEQFATHGFHGTSMDQLADAAGVTKPVLYRHFGSKRELYLELLDDVGRRLLEEIGKATAEASGPREQVEAGFAAYFGFVADNTDAFRVLFGGGTRRAQPGSRRAGPAREEGFAEAVRRVEEAIAAAIAVLIEADIDDEHRRLLAYGIVGLAEATGRWSLRNGRVDDPAVLGRRMADLTWAGLRGVHR